jgi:hypothetical protein
MTAAETVSKIQLQFFYTLSSNYLNFKLKEGGEEYNCLHSKNLSRNRKYTHIYHSTLFVWRSANSEYLLRYDEFIGDSVCELRDSNDAPANCDNWVSQHDASLLCVIIELLLKPQSAHL